MKSAVRQIFSLVLAAMCLISIGKLLMHRRSRDEGEVSYANAALIAQSGTIPAATQPPPATEPLITEPVPPETAEAPTQAPEPEWIPAPVEEDAWFEDLAAIDLAALREVNPDVVAWIYIPNTQIYYPLMQGDDNQFYLEHTWDGEKNPYGSIFLEQRCSRDLTDFNTVIYGHNMLNGSMFGELSSFGYQWFWEWNRYVYLVTDLGILRYEIFSSYLAEVDSPTYRIRFSEAADREAFIAMALENSQITAGTTPAATDRILTLSTCTGMGYESRRVVHAFLKMIPSE